MIVHSANEPQLSGSSIVRGLDVRACTSTCTRAYGLLFETRNPPGERSGVGGRKDLRSGFFLGGRGEFFFQNHYLHSRRSHFDGFSIDGSRPVIRDCI